jgi:hypothetical protein
MINAVRECVAAICGGLVFAGLMLVVLWAPVFL